MTIALEGAPRTDAGTMPASWLSHVNSRVILRSVLVAAVLGTLLTLTNQHTAIVGPARIQVLPLVLVFITPFVVVTISQASAARQASLEAALARPVPLGEGFIAAAMAHGIPRRAAVIGMIVGTLNTAAILAATVLEGGALSSTPLNLVVQVYALPIVFGVLSQAITFRRTVRSAEPNCRRADWPGHERVQNRERNSTGAISFRR